MLDLYTYLIGSTLFVYMCLVFYLLIGWLNKNSSQKDLHNNIEITVIIPFRNEEKNLENLLKSLFEVEYPQNMFEVILVNDNSEDLSVNIINNLIKHKENYKLIELSDSFGKKAALENGINNAKFQYILTTDADCEVKKDWLYSTLIEGDSMIVRPVLFKHNGFFDKIQALDFLSLTGTMISSFGNRNPILCNGANLMFKKRDFELVEGYEKINDIPTGDDILLMQKFIKSKLNIKIEFNQESIVYSNPTSTLIDYFDQRIRWSSKIGKFQSSLSKYIGLIVFLVNSSLLVSFILSIVNSELVEYFAVPFILKCVIDFLFLFLVASYFEEKRLLWYLIITELFNMVTVPIIAILSSTKKYTWKGRRY